MARKRIARKSGRRKKAASGSAAAGKTAGKSTARAAKTTARKRKTASRKPAGKKTAGKRAASKKASKSADKAASKSAAKSSRAPKLLTLTEVSKQTGISMPTLQRYKKEYQDRLETVGEGRTQRYKRSSLATFRRIKKENLKKRGRPRKSAASKSERPAKAGASPEGLISLSEIGRRTGISYPTLLRYVRLHGDQIPSHGTGRRRRFPPKAVPVFSRLRKESRRGRRKGSVAKRAPGAARGMEARLRKLEKSNVALERQVRKLVKALQRPVLR